MDARLNLISADSPAEEQVLLRELSKWSRAPAPHVLPARKAELPRLRALARRCQREVVLSSVSENGIEEHAPDDSASSNHIPEVIVVGPTIDPSLTELIEVLSRRSVVRLDDVAGGRAELPAGATAMVIWPPDRTPMGTIIAAIEALAEHNIRIGLLPCFGTDADRWAILKAFTFPSLPNRGRLQVIGSSLGGPNAPACVDSLGRQAPYMLRQPLDVLAFEGHGNPLDLSVGSNAILCARQGFETGTTAGPGLFPCYHDGVCFRHESGMPDAELIAGTALNPLLLFALTCYYLHLGASTFSQSSGIVPQVMSGDTVVAISSLGAVWMHPAIIVLGLSLIHEGLPLAEVAHTLDRLQRETLGLSAGLPETIPAIAVFGNPCARLQPLGVTDANIIERDGRTLVARSPVAIARIGAFLRVPLDDVDRSAKTWSLEGLPEGAWARGVQLESETDARLYVWLGEQALDGCETIRLSPLEQSSAELKTLTDFVEGLDFWPLFFDYCIETREARKGDVESLEQALISLPRWQRRFTRMSLTPQAQQMSVLVDGRERMQQSFVQTLALMGEFSIAVLDICAEMLAYDGFDDIGIYAPLLNGACDLKSGPCACGESELRSHQWVALTGPRPEIYRHACPCGGAGLDSRRYEVEWKTSPRTVRLSETLRLELLVTAPNDRYLVVKAIAVVLIPTRDRRVSGPVTKLLLAPGEQGALACEVFIPSDVTLGLHVVSVAAIINGSLVERCYMLELLAGD